MKKMFTLTAKQTKPVGNVAYASTSAQSVALRARIILDSAESGNESWIAAKYCVSGDCSSLIPAKLRHRM